MHPQKISVLFLPSWYPNRTYPSHGIFVKRHALAVSKETKATVIYVCSDKSLKSNFELEEKTEGDLREVIVYYKKVSHSIPLFSALLKLSRFWRAYHKAYRAMLAKQGRPDLLHLNIVFPAGIFALWLNRFAKIPMVITEQWSGYFPEDGNYKGFFLKYITQCAVKRAKGLITVSESLKAAMRSHNLTGKYFVLPNVVNTELFKPSGEKKERETKKRILHVSTVNDKEKNISGMLRAIKQVSLLRSDFLLDIVGDGPERIGFEELASELGLKDKFVFFKGYREAPEVARMMSLSDFYLMFSNYETFSTVIVEALAAGIPVVATAVGVLPSIIDERVGVMIGVGDEAALSRAVNHMLDEYSTFESQRLSEFAKQYFAQGNMGAKFVEIYKEALSD